MAPFRRPRAKILVKILSVAVASVYSVGVGSQQRELVGVMVFVDETTKYHVRGFEPRTLNPPRAFQLRAESASFSAPPNPELHVHM